MSDVEHKRSRQQQEATPSGPRGGASGTGNPRSGPPNRATPQTRQPRRISTPRKIVFSLICFGLALVLLEGVVRLRGMLRYGTGSPDAVDSLTEYRPELDLRVPRPGYERHSSKVNIKINSLGFRGEEITLIKPPGTLRIACLGASTTFCTEVTGNEATWPRRLQDMLNQQYPERRFQVINAGVPGYAIRDSLANLRHRVLPLEPDLVILYHANNDIAKDTRGLAAARRPSINKRGIADTLGRYSLLLDLLHKNAKILWARRQAAQAEPLGIPEGLPGPFIATLEEIHQLLSARDIPLVLSTFLVKYRRDQPRKTRIANADVAFYYMPWMTIDDLLDAIDAYNQAIVDYARAHGLPVVTARDSIPADEIHYADCMHMTDAGCELMAARFLGFLKQEGIIDEMIRKGSNPRVRPGETPAGAP